MPLLAAEQIEPFPEALRALLTREELSLRKLAALTPTVDGRGLGHAYIGQLATGAKKPTVANMELLAEVLEVDPRYFREYRAWQVQLMARRLAERHGADAVREKLAELED